MADNSMSYRVGSTLPPYDSCWKRINDHARAGDEKVIFVSMHQKPDLYNTLSTSADDSPAQYLRWNLDGIKAAGNRLAMSLANRGVTSGAPIFTFMQNSVEWIIVYWATAALECTLVPLNPRNLENATELQHMIEIALETCEMRPAVVVAGDASIALKLNAFDSLGHAVKIVVEDSAAEPWDTFSDLILSTAGHKTTASLNEGLRSSQNDDNFILFTSGTTSLPKACHWHYPNFASAHVAFRDASDKRYRMPAEGVMAVVGPNNHALALLFILEALCSGNKVGFPSASFDTAAFCRSMELEGVTHCTVAPVMAKALAACLEGRSLARNELQVVRMGGSDVSYEVMKACVDTIGAKSVEVLYGSTEGVLIDTGACAPADMMSGNDVCGGSVMPGCRVKVCQPGSQVAISTGQKGELHFSGPSLVNGYLDRDDANFYISDEVLWNVTGDQAFMDESGRVYIVGRYKDMIIRGAENIAPAPMEACIARTLPHLAHLQVQIVGAADEYAGEVPVAVTLHPVGPDVEDTIKGAIARNLGKMYLIDEVLSLKDLRLVDWPRTSIGKIQKTRLKERLQSYRQSAERYIGSQDPLLSQVKEIWARIVGLPVAQLSVDTQLADMADSITTMRVKDRISKQLGYNIAPEQMAAAGSIGGLVEILSSYTSASLSRTDKIAFSTTNGTAQAPPEASDMVHCMADDPEIFESTKSFVSKHIRSAGLEWSDVRDVFPAYDFTSCAAQNGTFDRWSFKIAIIARKHNVAQLREAFVAALKNNPMQASFLLWDKTASADRDTALHVIVAQQTELLQRLVVQRGSLKSLDQLKALALNDANHPSWPGPLVRGSLYYIEETRCAAMIWNMHHAIADAFFMQLTTDDLDAALSGLPLKPHVPYKLYCDSLHVLRASPMAQAAVKYHARKLKELSRHSDHLWPTKGLPLQVEDSKPDGYVHFFSASRIQAICKQQPHLAPSLVIKAANALFLMRINNYSHAIFSHVEAARDQFPFMPKSFADAAPSLNASDVGGQLFQSVVNLISIPTRETVGNYLARLQEEQNIQQKYAAAPWKEIMRQLNAESAELFPQVAVHCMFNWHGASYKDANAFNNIEIVDAVIRKDVAPFVNNCALQRSSDGDRIMLHLRGSVFSVDNLRQFALQIEGATEWLVDEANWDRGVSDFFLAQTSDL